MDSFHKLSLEEKADAQKPKKPINVFSIDLQSVATGKKCNDRSPAYICVIGEDNSTIYETFIKPDRRVVSYTEPYTGIKSSDLDDAPTMSEVTAKLKAYFGNHPTIVGQDNNFGHTIELMTSLGFEKEKDYKYIAISEWFKLYQGSRGGKYPYLYFTLDVQLRALLNKPLSRGLGSKGRAYMNLYNAYKDKDVTDFESAKQKCYSMRGYLRKGHKEVPFSELHPTYEGVCQGRIPPGQRTATCPCGTRKW
ncbi:unnamed protein product [Owenia fusiformis]|uniref:Exonuclease domain-containing protein n=1 Tax=Owenia fusiformis TaxID=6347 RepID=A0A8S4MVW5_OWEFU|nr:unnamed protein product [Owenia fusiformis]